MAWKVRAMVVGALCCMLGAMLVRGEGRRCVGYTSCNVELLGFQNACSKEEAAAIYTNYQCLVGDVAFAEYSAMEWDHKNEVLLAILQLYRTDAAANDFPSDDPTEVLTYTLNQCGRLYGRGIYINGTVYGSVLPSEQDVVLYPDTACASTETYTQQYGVTYNGTIATEYIGKSMATEFTDVFFFSDAACSGDANRLRLYSVCTEGPWAVGNQTFSYALNYLRFGETQMEVLDAPPSPEEVELDCGDYNDCSVGIMEFFDGNDCRGNTSFVLTDAPQCLNNSAYQYPYLYMKGAFDAQSPGAVVIRFDNGLNRVVEFPANVGCSPISSLEDSYSTPGMDSGEYWQVDGTSYYSVYAFSVDGESAGHGDQAAWEFYTDTACTTGVSPTFVQSESYYGAYSIGGADYLVAIVVEGSYTKLTGEWSMKEYCGKNGAPGRTYYQMSLEDGDCSSFSFNNGQPVFQAGGIVARSARYTKNTTTHAPVFLNVNGD